MSASGVRRFELYDFFSVLLPGIAFILGLYPLFPSDFSIGSASAILPLLAGGFVVGRAIHAAAVRIEDWSPNDSHRDLFAMEVRRPEMLNTETVEKFYKNCRSLFGEIGLPADRTNLTGKATTSLYTAVRSYVHIDSRGRSRTFQAVSAFYRSMWFVSVAFSFIYIVYGIFPDTETIIAGIQLAPVTMPYTTKIKAFEIPSAWFLIGSIILFTGSYTTFRDAKTTHRQYFVQYLITDFIVLYKSLEETG